VHQAVEDPKQLIAFVGLRVCAVETSRQLAVGIEVSICTDAKTGALRLLGSPKANSSIGNFSH
jgi:hypothetical protein